VKVGNFREALLYAGFLFIPAALVSLMLPLEKEDAGPVRQPME